MVQCRGIQVQAHRPAPAVRGIDNRASFVATRGSGRGGDIGQRAMQTRRCVVTPVKMAGGKIIVSDSQFAAQSDFKKLEKSVPGCSGASCDQHLSGPRAKTPLRGKTGRWHQAGAFRLSARRFAEREQARTGGP